MESSNARHPDEPALIKFLERNDQTADYVTRTAKWLQDKYPASAQALRAKLKTIYRAKSTRGQ